MIQNYIEHTAKKQSQKPDFYLLDSANDINKGASPSFNEKTVHLSPVAVLSGNSYWIKAGQTGGTAVSGLNNKSDAGTS